MLTLLRTVLLSWFIAQLHACAALLCASSNPQNYEPQTLRVDLTAPLLLDVRPFSEGNMWIVMGDNAGEVSRRSIFIGDSRQRVAPVASATIKYNAGEGGFAGDADRWWYSIAGSHENRWGVMFINGEGTAFVELPLRGPGLWLPLAGKAAKGVYVMADGVRTGVWEVTPSGIEHQWTIDQPLSVVRDWWSALQAGDGTFVLTSTDGSDYAMSDVVTVRHFSTDAIQSDSVHVKSAVMRIASVIDAHGAIAIAAQTKAAQIEIATVNHDKIGGWVTISGTDRAQSPHLSLASNHIYATWTATAQDARRRGLRIVRADGPPYVATTIADGTEADSSFAVVWGEGDQLRAVYQTDGNVMSRLLPDPPLVLDVFRSLHLFSSTCSPTMTR
jgi:hypothetical protein